MYYRIALLLLFSLLLSCDKNIVSNDNDCDHIYFNDDLYVDGPQDASTVINDAWIEGDCLYLSLSYSGGCMDHDIKLAAQGWIKTNPVKVSARVIHENLDLCEAWITEEKSFDLTELKYQGDDELIIILEGFEINIKHIFTD